MNDEIELHAPEATVDRIAHSETGGNGSPADPASVRVVSPVFTQVREINGSTPAVSAQLMRRLAAAAQGFQDGQEVFFTARFVALENGDFQLDGPFSREQLSDVQVPEGFAIFGPYQTPQSAASVGRTRITTVTVALEDGTTRTFEGAGYDALFWSLSALEKFALPHYAVVSGLGKAVQILQEFSKPEVFLMAHDPRTQETMFSLTPEGPAPEDAAAPVRLRATAV